jgi:hypothetical protein
MRRIKIVIMLFIMAASTIGCGNEKTKEVSTVSETTDDLLYSSETSVDDDDVMAFENGDVIFETEYQIEDYFRGDFIVSKSDGLLYGVLNLAGEEIIPVQYDEIEFLNEENINKGMDQNIYILTKYENQYELYDAEGNKLLDGEASIVSYEIGDATDQSPLFMICDENETKNYYNRNIELVYTINSGEYGSNVEVKWITPEMYLLSAVNVTSTGLNEFSITNAGTYLCDIYGDTKDEWKDSSIFDFDGVESDSYWIYLQFNDGTYRKLIITKEGDTTLGESISQDDITNIYTANATTGTDGTRLLGYNDEYKIYQTNDTWKYEDLAGNAVYDDRYYSLASLGDAYILSNGDNQACIITKNGNRTVNYGYVEKLDNSYSFNGMILTDENAFADDESVCFVMGNNGLNDVYYFSPSER